MKAPKTSRKPGVRQTKEDILKSSPRHCRTCKKLKPITEFNINKYKVVSAAGEKYHRYALDRRCKVCHKKRVAKRRLDPGYKDYERAIGRSWKVRHMAEYLIKGCKHRAILKKIPFNLKPEDLIIPKICSILKHPMHLAEGYSEYSPSVDRVDNSKGYIKGNVAVISRLANAMKNHCNEAQLKTFAKNIMPYVKKYRK